MSKEREAAEKAIAEREAEKAALVAQMAKRFAELGFTNEELSLLFNREVK